jgi:hypothetical protein
MYMHAVNHIADIVKMSYGRFSPVHISSAGARNEQEYSLSGEVFAAVTRSV